MRQFYSSNSSVCLSFFVHNLCLFFRSNPRYFPVFRNSFQSDLDNNPFDFSSRTTSHARSFNEKYSNTSPTNNLPRRNMPLTSTPNEEMVSIKVLPLSPFLLLLLPLDVRVFSHFYIISECCYGHLGENIVRDDVHCIHTFHKPLLSLCFYYFSFFQLTRLILSSLFFF